MPSNTLAEVSRRDLLDLRMPPLAPITDVKNLSSYNWIEAPTPTIAVPGSPPLWAARTTSKKVNKDMGRVYVDQNAARHPDSPLEPLFRALYITNPSFDIRSTDVVTDRNNIRKLLSFINPSSFNKLKAFTINIEVAKNTAIFCRAETATLDYIKAEQFKGYGRAFERGYTFKQISGSTGHHRIISYHFGGLNFLVRYETDGYVGDSLWKPSRRKQRSLLALSSTNSPPTTTIAGSKLTIRQEGQVVPHESILKIKTRESRRRIEIEDVTPQLWVSQTSKLVRAYYHEYNKFQVPRLEDVTAQIKTWEKRNQTHLRKLAALIHRIVDVVRRCGGSAMVKYDVIRDKLVVCKVDGGKMLPEDLYSIWDGKAPEAVFDTNHDARAEGVTEPLDGLKTKVQGQSVVSGPEDTKRKESVERQKKRERRRKVRQANKRKVWNPLTRHTRPPGKKTIYGSRRRSTSITWPHNSKSERRKLGSLHSDR